jgi:hypothetical protein
MFYITSNDGTFKAEKQFPVHQAMAAHETDFLPGLMIKKEIRL